MHLAQCRFARTVPGAAREEGQQDEKDSGMLALPNENALPAESQRLPEGRAATVSQQGISHHAPHPEAPWWGRGCQHMIKHRFKLYNHSNCNDREVSEKSGGSVLL